MSPPDTRQVSTEDATKPRSWQGHAYRWRLPLLLFGPVAVLAVAAWLYLSGGRYVSTDDAYIQADKIQVSADVPGRVVAVEVQDNQKVHQGDVLVRLDDAQYRIAVERAKAQLESARWQVKQALDNLAYRQREFDRQQQLFASHVTSQAKLDEARNALDVARQQAAGAPAGDSSDAAVNGHPLVQTAQAQLDQAELDLSHTVIYAPVNGVVTRVASLPVGQYLNAAAPAFALIATDTLWVEANFKETDLTHMLPGDTATVDVDTYPDKTFTARVESVGPGTGSEFSVLPAQNATGNWVKVVQRLPVRLVIENSDPDHPLRAGMSANVEVDTGYSRLSGWKKPQ